MITVPIIVDYRYIDPNAEDGRAWKRSEFRGIAMAVERFWVERTITNVCSWGSVQLLSPRITPDYQSRLPNVSKGAPPCVSTR
ncbi:MAG TPA: hypothetical protein VIM11_08800 [Tepidisphaeraceae bacterium]|jgi:hypothetical protein